MADDLFRGNGVTGGNIVHQLIAAEGFRYYYFAFHLNINLGLCKITQPQFFPTSKFLDKHIINTEYAQARRRYLLPTAPYSIFIDKFVFDNHTNRMTKILKVNNTSDYSRYHGVTDRHPLITVIDFSEISPIRHSLNSYGVYGVFVQDDNDLDLAYGCGKYDYRDGSLICVAPGQIGGKEDDGNRSSIGGWAMLFHPDLIHGTQLEKDIDSYSFFDYSVNEALHMNEKEHEIIVSIFKRIKAETENPYDDFQKDILVSYVSLLLRYCQRFYHRQFITRKLSNNDILTRFDSYLKEYFVQSLQVSSGLPSVKACAEHLCMSVNYFSDLIKKMTGESPGKLIRQFIIRQIKNELASGLSVAQVAYKLGFDYPAHLSRMFKKETGMTPTDYIQSLHK